MATHCFSQSLFPSAECAGFRYPKLVESILYYTYTVPSFQLAFSHIFSCTEKGRSGRGPSLVYLTITHSHPEINS